MPAEDVELAFAVRDYTRAAQVLRASIDGLPMDAAPSERGALLVRLAEAERRAGRPAAAWAACREAAGIARLTGDGGLLADAVLAAPPAGAGGWDAAAELHALGEEALRLLGRDDAERVDRLQALVAGTPDVWSGQRRQPIAAASVSPEARFAAIRARHDAVPHLLHAEERLRLAEEAIALGGDERQAEATVWQANAFAQLGRRVDLEGAVMRLGHAARRLREPAWDWRSTTAQASLALLDDDPDRASALAARALEVAGQDAGPEVHYVDVVLRAAVAMRTGRGLSEIDREIVDLLRGASFFAQGWRAVVLLTAGAREEALAIWRALAPRMADLPEGPVEWVFGVYAFATLALAAGDRTAAAELYRILLPLAGRYFAVDALTPTMGPVALRLGELAQLLDDRRAARRHLADAVQEADRMHDRHHASLARALRQALRDVPDPLSPRELEVARLVAAGLSNRAIADALHLSERTVENHVSHSLAKLALTSRAGIAAWVARHDAPSAP